MTKRTKTTKVLAIDEAGSVLDEPQAFYLGKGDGEGWVYTSVLRQLVNRMYRERDYLAKRQREGQHTAYDYAVDRDQKALAWAIRALVQHVPTEEKVRPEPPKPPRKPSRRLSARNGPRRRAAQAGMASPSATGTGRISPSGETGRLPPASALLGPSAVPTTPAPPGGGRRR
jgi:hypothetical protein